MIAGVVRREGLRSALVRARERIVEASEYALLRTRGVFAADAETAILNVSATSVAPRTGGVAIQLRARLRAESTLRSVALLHPDGLQFVDRLRPIRARGFENTVREAMAISGAKAIHIEGTSELPLPDVFRLIDSGVRVIVSLHDFTLADRRLLDAAAAVVLPSTFLRDAYGTRGEVIEPAVAAPHPAFGHPLPASGARDLARRDGVAFAGNVKPHKGSELLGDIARRVELHVFGGGDLDALPANAMVHGYYRAGTLPSLLARHRIGLVVLPSIVPEAYLMTLTEAWLAGASVVAFDIGAQGERIRRERGGWVAPLESGAAGLTDIIEGWFARGVNDPVPRVTASPIAAARAHLDLYRRLALLG
jgi:glycosyltransferase involved in cell wall biosynthesis